MNRFQFLIVLVFCLGACQRSLHNNTEYFGKYAAFLGEGEKEIDAWYNYSLTLKGDGAYIKRIFFPETMTLTSMETYSYDSLLSLNGPSIYFTDTGQRLREGHYVDDEKKGFWTYYNRSNAMIKAKGQFVNNKKEGRWKYYDSEGRLKNEIDYKIGKRDGGFVTYDALGRTINSGSYRSDSLFQQNYKIEEENETFESCEEMPYIASCKNIKDKAKRSECSETTLLKNIYGNLQYPMQAKALRLKGRVISQFIVTKEGKIKDLEVITGLNQYFKDEVYRTLSNMPKWEPGRQGGEKVDVLMTIPVMFNFAD